MREFFYEKISYFCKKSTTMSHDNPLVSIIMPVHNAEAYLGDSIASALGQTYGNFELICFNDASTDRSLEVLCEYAARDARIRVIDSEVNVGPGGGRNRAIRAAGGQYLIYLDADDRLAPQMLEKCVAAALQHDSEAVFFDYRRFVSDSRDTQTVSPLGADASALEGDALRRRILERTTSIWTAMYARSVITDNDLYFPEGVLYEDNAVGLAFQTIARNPIKINEILYEYRFDNQSITRSANNPRFFDRIFTAVLLLGHLRRLGLYDRFRDVIDYQFTNLYYINTLFGAIYRFDEPQMAEIAIVRDGIRRYLPAYKSNPYYRSQPLLRRIKIETHARWPRLIKMLSNLNRLLHHR